MHKVSKTGSYNDLSNIPVINQDLTASGFTPVANTYYKHTGTTTDTFTQGVIYLYNGTGYAALNGSGSGDGKTYVYYVIGDGEHASYDIEHPFGADVNVSVYLIGQSIFGETVDELVMVDVYTKRKKVKLVFNSAPSSGMKFKVVITGVVFAPSKVLNDNSWGVIRQVILAGEASNYWKVGDTKTITSKSGKTYTIRLVDLQDGRYEYSDGNGSSKAVFEFVECYNLNGTTSWKMTESSITDEKLGGWSNTLIKTVTLPEILADLPDDMVSAMSEVNVLSGIGKDYETTSPSINTLFLPAICELTNSTSLRINHNESPLGLFDYYSNDNSNNRVKNIVEETSNVYWWLRSPQGLGSLATAAFGVVQTNGNLMYDLGYYRYAIAPIFAIQYRCNMKNFGTIIDNFDVVTKQYLDNIVANLPPAPNNGKLTITVNGTAYTFTANQAGDTSFSIIDNDTGATNVEVTGAGNAVTTASYDASTRKLTLTKGTTFLTHHQDISGKLDKTTYEWNKEFAAGSNGAISLGRYNVYDTQLTFDISSTTSTSMNGKLVIATQNGRICQAKVFGDASGALISKIVIYQSAIVNNRSWIEIFCNFDGWSKNKVHIYGVALNSTTVTNQMSSVTFTNGIPSPITSGDS